MQYLYESGRFILLNIKFEAQRSIKFASFDIDIA
jgi:hypothetical protein